MPVKLTDLAGVCILGVRFCPTSNISHQHLLHSCHHHYVRVGVGYRENGLSGKTYIKGHSTCKSTVRDWRRLQELTSSYLFGKAQPVIHVQAEVTVSGLLLSRRGQAILLNSDPRPRTTCAVGAAAEHLTHRLVVQVHVEVCGHFSPFSYIQQSERHEEGLNLAEQIQISQ